MAIPFRYDPTTDTQAFSVRNNDVELTGVRAGPEDGPAVVLLHGFPEFSFSWFLLIPELSRAGFNVIAPDLRGYNLSSKPPRIADYRVEELVSDVVALIDQLAGGRAAVVGHDWGGVVAWYTAMWHPERISRLGILNAPHPIAYLRELRRPGQLLRSWYAFFFQLPRLPEMLIRRNHFAVARKVIRDGPARLSRDPDAEVELYIKAMSQPGALTAMLNWYRAALRRPQAALMSRMRRIDTPTLLIWGDRDRYLVRRLTEGLEPWVRHLTIEHLPDATHWVQRDEPERVNALLLQFLTPAG